MCCLWSVFIAKWWDKIPNIKILTCWMSSFRSMFIKAQICWSGHLVHMPDSRIPKVLFHGQQKRDTCSHGGHYEQYKDMLKSNLKSRVVDPSKREATAHDWKRWQQICRGAVNHFAGKCINTFCENVNRAKQGYNSLQRSWTILSVPHVNVFEVPALV